MVRVTGGATQERTFRESPKQDCTWSRYDESYTAVTPIGRYRVARGGGHAGVGAYFQRGKDEQALGRFGTIERARERCEQHYSEMRHLLKPVALGRSPTLK